ncbi:MAG: UDP-N-acetylmuramoyl-L-alanine--D-glutamate ligase [Dehalococcoidia bacterium]
MERLGLTGKKVTVVGLGIEGVDLVQFLARQGAQVTVSDAKAAHHLAPRLAQIADVPARLCLGANDPQDIASADAVFLSQSVPLDLPGLEAARRRGAPISSQMRLFLELCPGPVVGITGSSGKTTTTALAGAIFAAASRRHLVGGNIGRPLLAQLDQLSPDTWVVLEISHTQLQLSHRSPHIACVTNVTPNHLDQFSWEEYKQLKANILRHQGPQDYAILGYDDREARALARQTQGEALFFTTGSELPGDGVLVRDGWAVWRRHGRETPRFAASSLRLRGQHNLQNALAATAIASLCGIGPATVAGAVADFAGVPHRLEQVATVDGVAYYNDSIATTPERTLAGLRSFDEPAVLLLGGRDKHLPLHHLAREACRRCRGVVFFGEAGDLLAAAVTGYAQRWPPDRRPQFERFGTLAQAVQAAHHMAQPGDVVLLSPACTSFDAYNNFEERGDEFRCLVAQLQREVQPSPP